MFIFAAHGDGLSGEGICVRGEISKIWGRPSVAARVFKGGALHNSTGEKKPRIARLQYGGGAGIRTLGAFTLNGFQDRRFRPLSHPSKSGLDYIELLYFGATNFWVGICFFSIFIRSEHSIAILGAHSITLFVLGCADH